MSRLSNNLYLDRRRFLRQAWDEYSGLYSTLTFRHQVELHQYYQIQAEAPDDELLKRRAELSHEIPSLPQAAGKSFHRLYRAFRLAFEYAQGDELRLNEAIGRLAEPGAKSSKVETGRYHQPDRVLSIQAIAMPEIDPEKLAQALIYLVDDLYRHSSD